MNTIQSGLLFSLTGVAAVASMTSCTSQKKAEEQKQYNIVYIMTDATWRRRTWTALLPMEYVLQTALWLTL